MQFLLKKKVLSNSLIVSIFSPVHVPDYFQRDAFLFVKPLNANLLIIEGF